MRGQDCESSRGISRRQMGRRRHRRHSRFGGFGFGGRHEWGGVRGMDRDDHARPPYAGAGRSATHRACLDRASAAPRLRDHQAARGENRRLVFAEPGIVYPTLTYLEEAGYVTGSTEGSKKTLHHHRRRPRLSRSQSRLADVVVLDRLTSLGEQVNRWRRAARGERAIGAPAAAGRGRLRSFARDRRQAARSDVDTEASLVEILARTDAELQRRN